MEEYPLLFNESVSPQRAPRALRKAFGQRKNISCNPEKGLPGIYYGMELDFAA
jgi:hypothetical protein